MLAGGVEQLSQACAMGFSEPGVVLSEGACFFVVELSSQATARGVEPLATVHRIAQPDDSGAVIPATSEALISSAGNRYPGGIFIEDWVGRCLGGAGAAAVAAAIGAARQCEVPVVESSDTESVSSGRIAVDRLPVSEGAIRAVIAAGTDPTDLAMFEIAIEVSG